MYLFFDTETTGLPKNWGAPVTDIDNWPRLVQLAWLLYDSKNQEIKSANRIVIPEGFTIPTEASNVHGISTERAHKEGIDLTDALNEFSSALEEANFLIAHNISFDEKIAGAEFIRKNISNKLNNIPKICTMKTTTNICKIPGRYGYKWPNLTELHNHLFNKGFDDAHDALADVKACADCFFELKKAGMYQQQGSLF
ncbi:3'-5' exonuclease [Marinifilum sp. N1E240]|uniref:3'-5' exonuclease n=1 Tax=Marinifilum sp. N1E240 TaxID=2608082 RepID=UPI00128CFE88|nr:3'-5' exonuclease [Marinifilum sp. N1E240]MPQ47089.1 3'-5' exonuclease [Marinifilum sp. N1E240]